MTIYDEYEKTILKQISAYKEFGNFYVSDEDFEDLAKLLKIEKSKLVDSYNSSDYNTYNIMLFENILNYIHVSNYLKLLNIPTEFDDVLEVYRLFDDISNILMMMSVNISVFYDLKSDEFSREYLLYTFGKPVSWNAYLNHLGLFLNSNFYSDNSIHLPLIYSLLKYELETFSKTAYFVNSLLLISVSDYLSDSVKDISKKLLYDLSHLLKDGHIITLKLNSLYHNLDIDPSKRVKTDNTTCLQVYYSYQNSDVYSLRLDLSHEGVENIHYNNISPGGTKCYLFSKNEYLNIIREHPELSKFFIEYTDIFALKELKNCNIKDKKLFELYYDLCMAKQHEMINDEAYKEIDLISLMEVLSYILPIQFYSKIDNNDEYTNLCFIFANIMSIKGLFGLYLSLKDPTLEEHFINNIVDYAVDKNIINNTEKYSYKTFEGVSFIAELAQEVINRE